jgi:serine/threonine-protein kinase HipA
MEQLNRCPSTLAEGFQTYSPTALKLLFDGNQVSHVLPFNSPNHEGDSNEEYAVSFAGLSYRDCRQCPLFL